MAGEGERTTDASVFISYSRKDAQRVEALAGRLRSKGVGVWIDTGSIEPTADWMAEIRRAIEESDAVVAFLSGAFAESRVCRDELDLVQSSGKKLIPVSLEFVEPDRLPEWVAAKNWIAAHGPNGDDAQVASLVRKALETDLEWASEHARLLVRAREWELSGRAGSRLLRGGDIAEAEAALVASRPEGQPQPTALQREFVAASRRGRGRALRGVVAAAVCVAVLSLGLAGVAFTQRQTALEALADAEFRRFASESSAAANQSDALRLALEAVEVADRAGRDEGAAVVPLVQALGRGDLPVMHFIGLPDDQGDSGGHQGHAVSADGSRMAYARSDGSVSVVDLWSVAEAMLVPPFEAALTEAPSGYQVGLDRSGDRLARIVVPEYPDDGERFMASVEVFDLTGDEPALEEATTLVLGAPAAAISFGTRPKVLVVPEAEGTVTVADLEGESPVVQRLGEPEVRSNASYLTAAISADGSRVCTLGAALQLYATDPPRLLASVPNDRFVLAHGAGCIPDPCGGDPANVLVVVDEEPREVECVAPDGSTRGRSGYTPLADEPLVAVHGADLSDLFVDEVPARRLHRWGLEEVEGEGFATSYVYVEAPDDLVRDLGLTRVAPGPAGPIVVSMGVDGDLDVWRFGSGALAPAREIRAAATVVRVPTNQGGPVDEMVALAEGEGPTAQVVSLAEGEPVEASGFPASPDGLGAYVSRLADGSLLRVEAGGEASVHGADGTESTFAVQPAATTGVQTMHVGGQTLVQAQLADLRIYDVSTGRVIGELQAPEGDEYCAAAASDDGSVVVGVSCGGPGSPIVQLVRGPSFSDVEEASLPFRGTTAATVADDGRTVAVAFGLGEVAILRDGELIQPPELTTTVASHNDYASGWVALSADGQWLVSRRDSRGIELWNISGRTVSLVAGLSYSWHTDPPVDARVVDGELRIAWEPSPSNKTAEVRTWAIDEEGLIASACLRLASSSEQSLPVRKPDACVDPLPDPPEVAPVVVSTVVASPEDDGDRVRPEVTTTALPAESFPRAVTVASDGAIWVAASSADQLVRVDGDGVLSQFPIGDTSTSVGDLVADDAGGVWFAGFQTFGRMTASGQVELLPGFDTPGALSRAYGAVVGVVEAFDASLLVARGDSVDLVPVDTALSLADVVGMATFEGQAWATVNRGDLGPALASIGEDGTVEITQLDDLARVGAMVALPGAGLAFAGWDADEQGHIGVRDAQGTIELTRLPQGVGATAMAVSDGGVWFVTTTQLGRFDPGGTVTLWPIPGAQRLSSVAAADDGALWITDSEADALHRVELVPA